MVNDHDCSVRSLLYQESKPVPSGGSQLHWQSRRLGRPTLQEFND